ncbi:hypothetical protein JCGZ_07986 [Jatropha curcas]|uniref:Aminotransferase-like plant mobile domain-containing protein n=1 Tax=Jatropha curcas TaxID=180498 RepID=A0A067KWQ9_JATCU|nr:hypothetical protein JCGZ_07986 [Jatropha curcas]
MLEDLRKVDDYAWGLMCLPTMHNGLSMQKKVGKEKSITSYRGSAQVFVLLWLPSFAKEVYGMPKVSNTFRIVKGWAEVMAKKSNDNMNKISSRLCR